MSTTTSPSVPADGPTTTTFLEPERIKRPYPGSPPSENAQELDEIDELEDDNMDDDNDDQSVVSVDHPTSGDRNLDSSSQPPAKARKKPGRKPNPASPAVRKEQNRAAQRAFRDRKERHLQQLENMIKDLKDTHHSATARFQRESLQLKGIIESLQSENYYLREVVFSFESALGKTGNTALLQDVKVELYRRHYETHTARKLSVSSPATPSLSAESLPSPSIAPTPTIAPASMPGPVPVDDSIPQSVQVQMLNQAMNAAMAAHNAAMAANTNASANAAALAAAAAAASSSKQPYGSVPMSMNASTSTSTSNSWTHLGLNDPQDDNIFSMNNDVLYKASAPMLASQNADGRPSSSSSVDPIASARANLAASASWLSKQTFDDLQATLFAHVNATSSPNNSSNSKMSSVSPQTTNADSSLFGQMQDQNAFSPNQNMFTFTASSMDSAFPNQNSFLDSDDVDSNEFTLASHNLGFEDNLKQEDILPSYRLQMELRVLASATPATDPAIDPKVYTIPHDTRIDLIPCPKLRAKMILHQNEYNIEELCQLLLGGAICHGHPLDPHNWELPRAFFDRYGYLMGAELMKYKNKVWPKKTESMRHNNTFKNF
ncbi:hypothetical protein BGZ76_001953 [Entomortierella beljakovae]|nr:hypothetical protein BGZ76_001953 [Entomortierella beljakovae]